MVETDISENTQGRPPFLITEEIVRSLSMKRKSERRTAAALANQHLADILFQAIQGKNVETAQRVITCLEASSRDDVSKELSGAKGQAGLMALLASFDYWLMAPGTRKGIREDEAVSEIRRIDLKGVDLIAVDQQGRVRMIDVKAVGRYNPNRRLRSLVGSEKMVLENGPLTNILTEAGKYCPGLSAERREIFYSYSWLFLSTEILSWPFGEIKEDCRSLVKSAVEEVPLRRWP